MRSILVVSLVCLSGVSVNALSLESFCGGLNGGRLSPSHRGNPIQIGDNCGAEHAALTEAFDLGLVCFPNKTFHGQRMVIDKTVKSPEYNVTTSCSHMRARKKEISGLYFYSPQDQMFHYASDVVREAYEKGLEAPTDLAVAAVFKYHPASLGIGDKLESLSFETNWTEEFECGCAEGYGMDCGQLRLSVLPTVATFSKRAGRLRGFEKEIHIKKRRNSPLQEGEREDWPKLHEWAVFASDPDGMHDFSNHLRKSVLCAGMEVPARGSWVPSRGHVVNVKSTWRDWSVVLNLRVDDFGNGRVHYYGEIYTGGETFDLTVESQLEDCWVAAALKFFGLGILGFPGREKDWKSQFLLEEFHQWEPYPYSLSKKRLTACRYKRLYKCEPDGSLLYKCESVVDEVLKAYVSGECEVEVDDGKWVFGTDTNATYETGYFRPKGCDAVLPCCPTVAAFKARHEALLILARHEAHNVRNQKQEKKEPLFKRRGKERFC